MAIPNKIRLDNLDQPTDSPSTARQDIHDAVVAINAIIDELNMPAAAGALIGEIKILAYVPVPIPTNWLECTGASLSRQTYANLYSKIGVRFGSENTSSFNIPNTQRRVIVGRGGVGTVALGNAVGDVGGMEAVTLTTSEMPSHLHSVSISSASGHQHSFIGGSGSISVSSGGAHRHIPYVFDGPTTSDSTINDPGSRVVARSVVMDVIGSAIPTSSAGSHAHSASLSGGSGTIGTAGGHSHSGTATSTGGGDAHLNFQPSICMVMIIYAGPPSQ